MVGVVGSSPIVPTKIHETEFEKSNSVLFFHASQNIIFPISGKEKASYLLQ